MWSVFLLEGVVVAYFAESFVREWFTGRWGKGLSVMWFILLIVVFNRTKCRLTKRSQLYNSQQWANKRLQTLKNVFKSVFIFAILYQLDLVHQLSFSKLSSSSNDYFDIHFATQLWHCRVTVSSRYDGVLRANFYHTIFTGSAVTVLPVYKAWKDREYCHFPLAAFPSLE